MFYKEKMAPRDGEYFGFHLGLDCYNLPKDCQCIGRHLEIDKVHDFKII